MGKDFELGLQTGGPPELGRRQPARPGGSGKRRDMPDGTREMSSSRIPVGDLALIGRILAMATTEKSASDFARRAFQTLMSAPWLAGRSACILLARNEPHGAMYLVESVGSNPGIVDAAPRPDAAAGIRCLPLCGYDQVLGAIHLECPSDEVVDKEQLDLLDSAVSAISLGIAARRRGDERSAFFEFGDRTPVHRRLLRKDPPRELCMGAGSGLDDRRVARARPRTADPP